MTAPETDARFLACLAETLKWEGGFSNDPYDPGGATMNGIIQKEYDAYRLRKGLAKQSVRSISKTERAPDVLRGGCQFSLGYHALHLTIMTLRATARPVLWRKFRPKL